MESVVVSYSNILDGKEAALCMIDDINKKIQLEKHSIGILFCAASLNSKELLKTIKEETDIVIVGCSSGGEMSNEGYLDDSAVLMVLTSNKNVFYSGVIEEIKNKNKEELKTLLVEEYNNCTSVFDDIPSLMLTFPNFKSIESAEHVFEIISSCYPELPMFGGASAIDFNDDNQNFTEFYLDKVYEGSMPYIFIKTDIEPFITYENISEETKCENIGNRSLVGIITNCEGGIIKEIDNLPAYEFVKKSIDIELDASEVFILYPLLVREKSFSYTRVILNIDRYTGYLSVAGNIKEGSQVSIQILSYDFVEKSTKEIMKRLENNSKGKIYKNAISVSCACRKLINIFDKERETEIIKSNLSINTNLIGFYSFGEISPIKDNYGNVYNFYNNETISICMF